LLLTVAAAANEKTQTRILSLSIYYLCAIVSGAFILSSLSLRCCCYIAFRSAQLWMRIEA
jgi:hypothetical protein